MTADSIHDGLVNVVVRDVIEVRFRRGKGVDSDPVRVVTGYFTPSGLPLAEYDPHVDSIPDHWTFSTLPEKEVVGDLR